MIKSLLLTSFNTWKAHHKSNSSDDLLEELLARDWLSENVHLLRKLPVDFELAPQKVIARIKHLQPDIVVCCGMAERRSRLSVESNGKHEDETIHTTINLHELIQDLSNTRISHNAGKFVCNHTYYSILKHLQNAQSSSHCVFIHVPVLNDENRNAIAIDFLTILNRLTRQASSTRASSKINLN